MDQYTLHETFVAMQYSCEKWEAAARGNHYFEIIFIEKGSGYQTINDTRFAYGQGDIFLLAPEDANHFEVDTYSTFTHFKFSELLFSNKNNLPDRKYWLQRIEQIINHPNLIPADVIRYEQDRSILWNIHDMILREFHAEKTYYRQIISNAISTSLSIIARNISETYDNLNQEINPKTSRIQEIITYIQQHVYDNNLTKISYLAKLFHMSQSAISAYFKKQTGESIHQYITHYKMKLAQNRLQHTQFTVAEIAYQLGYTDESHLTKTFKKYFFKSPRQFRKESGSLAH